MADKLTLWSVLKFKEFSINKVLQDDMEDQEQQAPLKNQTDVCPVLTALENTLFGKKQWGPYTLATFSVIKGNNFCDFLFALKQLAGQVVDASEFESPIGRVELIIV